MRPASACSAFAVGCRRLTSFAAVRSFNTCRMYLILYFGMPAISMAVMTIFVQEDSMLAQVFGGGERRCNSSHHQAVDRLGKGLHAVAFAPDGVMEAAEGENTLLVQFHPEAMGEEGAGVLKWLLQ